MYLYQNADSFFHLLHPVTKFLLLLLLVTLPFFAPNLYVSGILLGTYMLLLVLSGGFGNLLKFWKMLLLFLIFIFLIWIIVPKLRGLGWSFQEAGKLAIRIDTFVIAGIFFGTITRIEEFTYALTKLGVPYKAAFALSLGFRLVPLFYQNLRTIIDAQRSRGIDLDSAGLLEKGKMYLPMISILISYGLRNADLMAMSLESKGFGYPAQRTSFLQPKFGSRDVVALLAVLSVLVFLAVR